MGRDRGRSFFEKCLLKIIVGLSVGLLFAPVLASAGKIVVVMSRTDGPYQEVLAGFSKKFTGDVKVLSLEKNGKTKDALVQTIVDMRADAVVAVGAEALQALASLNPATPLVYTMVYEPLEAFKARAGGVVLKISLEEQFARMKKYFPARKQVGLVYNPAYSGEILAEARNISENYGLSLYSLPVDGASEVPSALLKITPANVDLLWMTVDRTMAQPAILQQLIQHAREIKIPFIGLSPLHVKMGALACFSLDFYDIGTQTAELVQEGLEKNWKKQVHPPRRIGMTLNRETLKQLGLPEFAASSEIVYIQ